MTVPGVIKAVTPGKTVPSKDDLVNLILNTAHVVRGKHFEDIESFLAEGYSENDCYTISSELAKAIREELRGRVREVGIVRLHPDIKHYIVRVVLDRMIILVDPVPELSGQFDEILNGPILLVNPTIDSIEAKYELKY